MILTVLQNKILGVLAVLRIRDVYPGSEFFPSRIQGQHKNSGSRIRIRIKEFKFLSSRKYDSGFSSRIRMFYPSRIPDPGIKKALNSGSRTRKTVSLGEKCPGGISTDSAGRRGAAEQSLRGQRYRGCRLSRRFRGGQEPFRLWF
jgi:hypothetical protein